MKFQLKALAAAMVLAAAVPAQAAIDFASTGNSSLSLAVFDSVNNVSALFDLGKSYSDFSVIGSSFADSNIDALGTNLSWNLTGGDYSTAWNTFLSSANIANLQFAVIAADNNAGTAAGNKGIISTLNAETVTSVNNLVLLAQLAGWDTYLAAGQTDNGTIYQNHLLVDNGASVGNSGKANTLGYFGQNKNNAAGGVSVGNIGQSLAVYQQVSGPSTTSTGAFTLFGNNATFTLGTNGVLTYATAPVVEVPEADTWAMMMLGLGFMGFVARRKQA
ncbi:PEP-CTERM sorting domain-containing protein [Methylotenera sp. N17]|uniref:PEP-CTERM sorting domain-containing protein n=1 Tax=Methylotenera sp. N17 TaxID=1502761 RepID=UPI0006473766|nr:PEP-CTERM sorting domain-containing protein [Methylotenera sp. N17]